MALWNQRAEQHQTMLETNVFSEKYKGAGGAPKPGDKDYGLAVIGSETEKRAKAAKAWVDKEIDKLLEVIQEHGKVDAEDGKVVICFGPLFYIYQDISDTLVGILMRSKKRKKVFYKGDMLWQGKDDLVAIKIL